MAEINSTSYLAIAEDYATAVSGLSGLSQHYYDAAYEILILSVFDPELDLLQPFYNAYLATSSLYSIPLSAVSAVAELQRHILSRATTPVTGVRYTDVNDWLSDQGIQVPEDFADVSNLAGFTIDPANIS